MHSHLILISHSFQKKNNREREREGEMEERRGSRLPLLMFHQRLWPTRYSLAGNRQHTHCIKTSQIYLKLKLLIFTFSEQLLPSVLKFLLFFVLFFVETERAKVLSTYRHLPVCF